MCERVCVVSCRVVWRRAGVTCHGLPWPRWAEIPAAMVDAMGMRGDAAPAAAAGPKHDAPPEPEHSSGALSRHDSPLAEPTKAAEAKRATVPELLSSWRDGGPGVAYAEEDDLSHLGERWLMVCYMMRGHTRYLVSPAFSRDIASWSALQQTWDANQREVATL